jgi:hypothetical protein
MPTPDGYMTDEETKTYSRDILNNNPGNRWIFEHCGKTWKVSERVPPCIICPECGDATTGFTDNTCSITCDGCGEQCPRYEAIEFPKKALPAPVSDGLDDRDEFEDFSSKFGHKECA